jgi:hypothetical protein
MNLPNPFSRPKPAQYRHGDVMLERVVSLPASAKPQSGAILARGELTGHSHRIAHASAAKLFLHNNQTFVQILQSTSLIHEEHHAIPLEPGVYRFWMQREYHPKAIVTVRD